MRVQLCWICYDGQSTTMAKPPALNCSFLFAASVFHCPYLIIYTANRVMHTRKSNSMLSGTHAHRKCSDHASFNCTQDHEPQIVILRIIENAFPLFYVRFSHNMRSSSVASRNNDKWNKIINFLRHPRRCERCVQMQLTAFLSGFATQQHLNFDVISILLSLHVLLFVILTREYP